VFWQILLQHSELLNPQDLPLERQAGKSLRFPSAPSAGADWRNSTAESTLFSTVAVASSALMNARLTKQRRAKVFKTVLIPIIFLLSTILFSPYILLFSLENFSY
jgi:hypothetical protein